MTWGINLPCSAPASLIVDTVEKMSDLTRRAVAIGAPLACGALVMHMYASMSFEHEAQILLYCEWFFDLDRSLVPQDHYRCLYYLRLCRLAAFSAAHRHMATSLANGDGVDVADIVHIGLRTSRFANWRNAVAV